MSSSGKLLGRASRTRIGMAVYAITMGSILNVPLLGYGYGTFADVFPMFRDQSVSTWGMWEQAPQYLSGSVSRIGPLVWINAGGKRHHAGLALRKGAMARQESEEIPCVAASVGFLLGVHALVDFSLQMQAIAITFMAVLGAGVAQSMSSRLKLAD